MVKEVSDVVPNPPLWRQLKHWVGMDRAILFTVCARFWSSGAGVITVLLIARFLTPTERGYYYTFSSLVALQVIFELGFSFVVLQLAAHERAQLTFLPDGRVEGDAVAHSRLASILQKAVRWYFVAGILMTAVLLPVGFMFFGAKQNLHTDVAWGVPWCLLVIASMLAFQIDPVFSFLEGCGYITDVARRRFVQAIVGSILAWIALFTHHGLYAPAMIILGQVAVGAAMILSSSLSTLLKGLYCHTSVRDRVDWRTEILPFQWRIAVSWLCGYFIYQIFSPILFRFQGPTAAGQMGMSVQISSAISGVALSWINTKASPFGSLIARKDYTALDKLFFRAAWQSWAIYWIGALMFLLVLIYGGPDFPKLAKCVLEPWSFALLLVSTSIGHASACQALYLRAHKREPFLWVTIVSSILIATSTLALAPKFGVNGVIVGTCIISVLYGLPAGTFVFISKRRQWHDPNLCDSTT
jgi:O-antigen/teichoic acid export membrane protein